MSDISNGLWSPTDGSNTAAPPQGWPAGMLPNAVEPTAQAMMGATKRWWERANAGLTTTGSAGAYVVTPTNTLYPTAYSQGEIYAAKANFTAVGNDTLNYNGLGAKKIYTYAASGIAQLGASQILINQPCVWIYDGALDTAAGGFVLINPALGATAAGPAVLASGNLSTGTAVALTVNLSTYSAYTRYALQFERLLFNSGTSYAGIQFSTDGGSTFVTTANYNSQIFYASGAGAAGLVNVGQTAQTSLRLATGYGGGAASALTGSIDITSVNSVLVYPAVTALITQYATASNAIPLTYSASGYLKTASAITGFKLYDPSGAGTVSSGAYRLIGYP